MKKRLHDPPPLGFTMSAVDKQVDMTINPEGDVPRGVEDEVPSSQGSSSSDSRSSASSDSSEFSGSESSGDTSQHLEVALSKS